MEITQANSPKQTEEATKIISRLPLESAVAAGTDRNMVPSGNLVGKPRGAFKNHYQQLEQLISLLGAAPITLSSEFGLFNGDEQPPKNSLFLETRSEWFKPPPSAF